MITRLLSLLLITVALPALAQQRTNSTTTTTNANTSATTVAYAPPAPAVFLQLKTRVDSIVMNTDTLRFIDKSAFNGKARIGRYRVECYYNKPTKEMLRMNFLFITDSLNFNKDYYFHGNSVIKINDNNTATYYQVGDHMFTEQGQGAPPAIARILTSVISDTFQSIYGALFP